MWVRRQRPSLTNKIAASHGATGKVAAAALVLFIAAQPISATAHSGGAPTPETFWSAWNWDPLTLTALLAIVLLFWRGTSRIWRRLGRGNGVRIHQAVAFAGAVLTLTVAIVSPLDALGEALFSAHMVQHLLLILVAAPLLVVARPMIPALRALPPGWRGSVARLGAPETTVRRVWSRLTTPVGAWVVHGLTIWAWHVPVLYDAAIASELVHVVEHVTFLGTGVLFWWSIIPSARFNASARHGLAVLSLFTTAFHSSLLAAIITFSRGVWYESHRELPLEWGLSPLQDQQLAGAIMWLPMGTIYAVAAAIILAVGLRRMEAKDNDDEGRLIPSRRSPELG